MSRFLNERLAAFSAYVPGEQPKNASLIKLNTNESPFPPSPMVMEAVNKLQVERLRLYSDLSATDLIQALSEDLDVGKDMLITGNGSDEILYFAMLAFGGSGARFPDITYGFYPVWAELIGIPFEAKPLRDDFSVDPEDYAGNDRMVVLANPNAPTGIAMPRAGIEQILQANPDRVVLIDEAYVDFGGESALPLVDKYENLLVARTFSKSRQMAGARLGFAVGQPALIQDLDKMRFAINPYNVNSLTQIAGAASVRDPEYFRWTRDRVINARDYTSAELTKLGFVVLPSCANFVFAKPCNIGARDYVQALRARNILVRWFDKDRIRDYARISIGSMEQMRALIDATAEIVGG